MPGSSPEVVLYDVNGVPIDASNPLRIDPTGTTTQPVSATSLPLPTGAATEATLATRASEATLLTRATEATLAARLAEATFVARVNTLGQNTMAASTPVVVASNQSTLPVSQATAATFSAVYDRIPPATNKYMATLFNTSAIRKVVIQEIYAFNWQITAVAGSVLSQEMRLITARTVGVAVTPVADDTNDVLSAGITADTNSTVVTDSSLFKRIILTNEEASLAAGIVGGRAFDTNASVYHRVERARGITLRQNQGITIKNVTVATVGSVSYVIVFTDEVA